MEELRQAIRDAFPDGQPPERPITECFCIECGRLDAILGGHAWSDFADGSRVQPGGGSVMLGRGGAGVRSRWITILTLLALLGGVAALHSWSLRSYTAMARKDSRPATLEEQLQQFRDETDPCELMAQIRKFGRVQDPRVLVALMDVVHVEAAKDRAGSTETPGLLLLASFTVVTYHIPKEEQTFGKYWTVALRWWEMNENVVRCRALTRMGEVSRGR